MINHLNKYSPLCTRDVCVRSGYLVRNINGMRDATARATRKREFERIGNLYT